MPSTLCIQVPFGRLEKATNKSSWCAQHAADLSSGHAWWNRLRYLVAVVQVLLYVYVCVYIYMYIWNRPRYLVAVVRVLTIIGGL
jgi:hypothetical protein